MTEDVPMVAGTAVGSVRRALGISEIVQQIIEHCSKHSLASLGRVDRSLGDAALNELWRSQIGLTNLMRCLPSHLRVNELSASVRLYHSTVET